MAETRIILHGCSGAMGQVITRLAQEDARVGIVAGLDLVAPAEGTYPVFARPADCHTDADVIIDFSAAAAVDALVDYAVTRGLPAVICTTGLSQRQLARIEEAAKVIPVLRSANMSLGVNTVFRLAAAAAQILGEAGYDMEIVEKHHNKKADAPSGTALAIADVMNTALGGDYVYQTDRCTKSRRRDKKEIGISAVRGGTIPGEHEVIFCGEDEVLTIKHTAYSKAIFGKGALSAAVFLNGKAPGLYTMADVIG